MPLWKDNTSKDVVISKLRQYILLNQLSLSFHKISEFFSSLALDLPEQNEEATPYYLAYPWGYSRAMDGPLQTCCATSVPALALITGTAV